MVQQAKVVEADREIAKIMVIRRSACSHDCSKCAGCGGERPIVVRALNTVMAKKGDFVLVETVTSDLLKKAFIVYMMPIIVFIAGYFAFVAFSFSEGMAAILAGIMFIVAIGGIMLYDRRLSRNKNLPKIIGFAHCDNLGD